MNIERIKKLGRRRSSVWVIGCVGLAIASTASAATNNYNFGGQGFGYGHGVIQPPTNMTFTNAGIRDVTISVGQLSGVNPQTGAVLTNTAYLLPLKAQSLTVVGGTLSGNGSGITNLNASAISSGLLSASRLPTSGVWNARGLTVSNLNAGAMVETDPQVGANSVNYLPKWNGSALVSGTVYNDTNGNIGIGATTPLGQLHVQKAGGFSGVSFTGTGLNDLTVNYSGYTGTGDTRYMVKVSNPGPTPNLFRFSTDNGATWSGEISMVASGYALGYGVTIGFAALGGHTYDNQWAWTVSAGYPNNLVVRDGKVGIGTAVPTTALEVLGTVKAAAFIGNGSGLTNLSAGAESDPLWRSASGSVYSAIATKQAASTAATDGELTVLSNQLMSADATLNSKLGTLSSRTSMWNSAYGWGNHGTNGYLKVENDPQVGANSSNYLSKWNGSALVSGTVYDNGNIGIGTTNPGAKLDVTATIENGRLADLPLFGGFSRLIQSAFAGFNLFSLTAFSADYEVHDGALWSENAQLGGTLLSARGHGSYSPEKGLDFTVAAEPLRQTDGKDNEWYQIQRLAATATAPLLRLLEFKLQGPLENPDWRFVNLSK